MQNNGSPKYVSGTLNSAAGYWFGTTSSSSTDAGSQMFLPGTDYLTQGGHISLPSPTEQTTTGTYPIRCVSQKPVEAWAIVINSTGNIQVNDWEDGTSLGQIPFILPLIQDAASTSTESATDYDPTGVPQVNNEGAGTTTNTENPVGVPPTVTDGASTSTNSPTDTAPSDVPQINDPDAGGTYDVNTSTNNNI
jgi:hypothetical protein